MSIAEVRHVCAQRPDSRYTYIDEFRKEANDAENQVCRSTYESSGTKSSEAVYTARPLACAWLEDVVAWSKRNATGRLDTIMPSGSMIRYAAWDPTRDLMRLRSLYAPTVGRDLLYTSLDDLFDDCIYSFI